MKAKRGGMWGASKRSWADATLAAFVVLMVGMMVVPLPTMLLDVLLASNIAVAVLMLLVSLYLKDGLSFTAFPTVLLVTTLYRLALNVSSTRLILLQADAGSVIQSFGDFVVRGNYVVGAVIFLILTLIQFVVIAKGSERVAEVGARFTLDAMPGKQMSIDAEIRAGTLSHDDARKGRRLLQREAEFYGAMDGAMKFVKGDAIAGIVITAINIVAGLSIGVAMRDMAAGDAMRTYGLLTIGDGLVSQIPALLISTASGLVVTRVSSEDEHSSLGQDIGEQVFGDGRALRIAAAFLVALSLVPGLPMAPFMVLGLLFLFVAYRLQRGEQRAAANLSQAEEEAAREARAQRALVPLVVPLAIEVADDLGQAMGVDNDGGRLLKEAVPKVRHRLFMSLGLLMPGVRVRTDATLGPGSYRLRLQELSLSTGAIAPDRVLVKASPDALSSLGMRPEPCVDPRDGEEASLVSIEGGDAARAAGFEVADAPTLIAEHLAAQVRLRARSILGLHEVQGMLEQLERVYPALVRQLVPKPITVSLLTGVLQRLVEEGISVRPLREILEALAEALQAEPESDPVTLTEAVRKALGRYITHSYASEGALVVHVVDPMIEEVVRDSIQRTGGRSQLAIPPEMARDIVSAIDRECGRGRAVLLTQADVRRFLRRLIEVDLPHVAVLSYQELAPDITIQPLGRVSV